jgi:hypothetical protein
MSAHGPPRKRKARPQARSSQVELPKDGALSIDVRRRSRSSFSQPFTSPCLRETPLARWGPDAKGQGARAMSLGTFDRRTRGAAVALWGIACAELDPILNSNGEAA